MKYQLKRPCKPLAATLAVALQLAAIAARHVTRMADAMIAACVARALETGEPLDIPERRALPAPRGARPAASDGDWDRLMRANRAPRRRHGL